MHTEWQNERKFVVTYLPVGLLKKARSMCMREGYLAIQSEHQVQISDCGGRYSMTIRRGKRLKIEETEIPLSAEQFQQMWPLTQHLRIEKSRYRVELVDHRLSLDVFGRHLQGLIMATALFDSEISRQQFTLPDYADFEVTHRREYQNEHLARVGMPASPALLNTY
ncbi:MAG: adenylate cyclase [Alteromonadaceae bacterium]|nr:adenylate cyclase [Alteromonadaceae bacterium]